MLRELEPPRAVARELPRAVALARIDQIDAQVRHPRQDGSGGFGGADVETAVHLAGVGRDDGDGL